MTDLCSVFLIGRLTKDLEIVNTPASVIGKASIAVNQYSYSKKQEEAHFFDFFIVGKMASSLQQYMVKGERIGIQGYLIQQRWTGKDGKQNSKVQIKADHVQLLGVKKQEGQKPAEVKNNEDDFKDDIPF